MTQTESNQMVDWNRLRLTDLRAMCQNCNISTEGTKAELIARLEDFWNRPERDSGTKKLDKGKAVDPKSNDDYSERPLLPEDSDGQNYTFLSYMENRLEQKIDEKLGTVEVHELLRLRAFVLRVVEEEGWNVVAKIPKPTPSEGDEFKELLVEARKQVKPYEGRPTSYSRRSWKSKRTEFWAPVQGYQNPNMIQNPGPAYQNPFNKPITKQITCYFCGGASHTASVYPSKEQTEGNNEQYGQKQGGGWENPRARGRELLDKGDKPTTRSNLLVKKSCTPIPKKRVDPGQKKGPETLQINLEQKLWLKKEVYRLETLGAIEKVAATSLCPGIVTDGKEASKRLGVPFYKARSDRYWGLYKKFCKRFDLDVKNPHEEEQYLKIRPEKDGESPLFVSRQGKKVSVSAVGSIVKRFAEHVGLNGRFTAHSLRIGGATAAMAAGISLTQIRAIGGWDSKAVMLYLRT
ncbi:36850_t:CDS:2, partial [Racocetra persica]